jgi:hypothetical protein
MNLLDMIRKRSVHAATDIPAIFAIDADNQRLIAPLAKLAVANSADTPSINSDEETATSTRESDMHSCNSCGLLQASGVCKVAVKIGAMPGYRPVLGRRLDHRCPEWVPP